MSSYKPSGPFVTPVILLTPTYMTVKGVRKKVYPADGPIINCCFKTSGGTEKNINDVYSGAVYEVMNEPENIDMRNQYCKFKVRRVKGGA